MAIVDYLPSGGRGFEMKTFNVKHNAVKITANDIPDAMMLITQNLLNMIDHYVELANSGDAGFWNPWDEDVIENAVTALNKIGIIIEVR